MLAGRAPRTANSVWHSNRAEQTKKISPTRPESSSKTHASNVAIPDFIAPQLCRSVTLAPEGPQWVHEIKFDGYRMQLRVEDAAARMLTRKGLDWTEKFAAIATAARPLPDAIIDGEVVALNHDGAPDFAALQAALLEGRSSDLVYFAFDLLFAQEQDLRKTPLLERKERLSQLLSKLPAKSSKVIRYTEHMTAAGEAVLKSACKLELEGIVSKRTDGFYQSGRSDGWLKAKCRAGHEVVIGGWSGSQSHLRSLIVGVYRGDHLVHTGRVGTGFNSRNISVLLDKLVALSTNTAALSCQHVESKANRKDLSRLSSQRSHGDRGRSLIAARATRRPGFDARDLGAGKKQSRSHAFYHRNRRCIIDKEQPVGRLRQGISPARRCGQEVPQMRMHQNISVASGLQKTCAGPLLVRRRRRYRLATPEV